MQKSNKRILWVSLFAIFTFLTLTVTVNDKSIFKPQPAILDISTESRGLDAQMRPKIYVIHKKVPGYKAHPLEGPVKVGILLAAVISYLGILNVLIENFALRVLVLLLSIPVAGYILFAAAFFQNFK